MAHITNVTVRSSGHWLCIRDALLGSLTAVQTKIVSLLALRSGLTLVFATAGTPMDRGLDRMVLGDGITDGQREQIRGLQLSGSPSLKN